MNENITVSKDVLIEAHKNANVNVKETLECIFGKEMFPKNVMDRVKTFDDALNELGYNNPLVIEYIHAQLFSDDSLAYMKLRIITAALNEGWEPQFSEDELRYYPCFYFYTEREIGNMSKNERNNVLILEKPIGKYVGLVYVASSHVPARIANIGSRLCFKSEELADYASKQFIDIYTDYYLK